MCYRFIQQQSSIGNADEVTERSEAETPDRSIPPSKTTEKAYERFIADLRRWAEQDTEPSPKR